MPLRIEDCTLEVRGPRRHVTHSKMMVCIAPDRAVNRSRGQRRRRGVRAGRRRSRRWCWSTLHATWHVVMARPRNARS